MASGDLEVAVAPASLARSRHGGITGEIWCQFENGVAGEFPEAHWSDFPVAILGGWLRELAALKAGERPEAICHFMDGPFTMRVVGAEDGTWCLQCDGGAAVREWRLAADAVLARVHSAARLVLGECDRREWRGRDVEALRQLVERLSRPAA